MHLYFLRSFICKGHHVRSRYRLMEMYCEHCHRTFADDDMKWKKGYHDYSYRAYPVCPFCSSEDIEEKEDDTEDEE